MHSLQKIILRVQNFVLLLFVQRDLPRDDKKWFNTLLLQIKVIIQVAMQSSICSTNGDFLQSYAQKNETFFGVCSKNVFICENIRFKKNDAWFANQ